jgi:RNA polymerase sigma factor for flagellar operon FliA
MPETPSPGRPKHVPYTTHQLISEHLALVGYVVSEISMRLPTYVDRDDLRSAGLEGLVQASRAFSESKGVPFRHYAISRIRGAIMDDLRRNDWASRSVRQAGRAREQAVDSLVAALGENPSTNAIADYMGISVKELRDLDASLTRGSVLSLDAAPAPGTLQASDTLESTMTDPEDQILENELHQYLRAAVSALPERLREVISRYFLQGHPMADIARDLNVTESRVSQLRAEAMVLIRDGINSHLAPEQVTPASRPGGSVDRKRSAYFAAVAEHRLHSMKQESQNFVSVTEATREQPSVEVVA